MNVKLFPTRSERNPVKIIADFDALISEPIGFKFQSKSYVIKPIDTETFMKIAKALQKVQELTQSKAEGNSVSDDDVYQGYLKFVEPVCPEITLKALREMTLAQINALVHLIVKHMTGGTNGEMRSDDTLPSGEKKNLLKA